MKHFRIGGAIDTVLTNPEDFSNLYAVSHVEAPMGLMGAFIAGLPCGLLSTDDESKYQEAYDATNFRIGIKTAINLLWNTPKYREYYLAKCNPEVFGKSLLSKDELGIVMKSRERILNSPFQKYFLLRPSMASSCSIMHQVPLFFDWSESVFDNVECKALLDGIMINHNEKVIQLFDLKSSAKSIYDFHGVEFYKYGYYIQAAFYMHGIRSLRDRALAGEDISDCIPHKNSAKLLEALADPEYTIANFLFIVLPKTDTREPIAGFEITEDTLRKYMQGDSDNDVSSFVYGNTS